MKSRRRCLQEGNVLRRYNGRPFFSLCACVMTSRVTFSAVVVEAAARQVRHVVMTDDSPVGHERRVAALVGSNLSS